MKAHKRTLTRKEWQVGLNEMYPEVYMTVAKDVVVQTLAVVLNVLETSYGWKGKRQLEFVENFISVKELMNGRATGREYDTDDLIAYSKTKYGIDLENIIEIEVEEK